MADSVARRGRLSERAKQRAAELARDADIRMTVPRPRTSPPAPERTVTARPAIADGLPMPGAVLTREYRGRTIEVTVLPKGFGPADRKHSSLASTRDGVTRRSTATGLSSHAIQHLAPGRR